MKPRKKGRKYEIAYRCAGHKVPFYEQFDTLEEANYRIAQIELEKAKGIFIPPKKLLRSKKNSVVITTVAELMDEYVDIYGVNHWGDSYLSSNLHRIEHYIKPIIGDVHIKELTAYDLDQFYDILQDMPAIILKGHKKSDEKISLSVIEKIHSLLNNALKQAVKWGCIPSNPAENATCPKYKPKTRDVWDDHQALYAIENCYDPILKVLLLLALGCSMRIGEILGLTWDCVDFSDESIREGTAHVKVEKELKRCDKKSLEKLDQRNRSKVLFIFPEWKKTGCSTSLVLKLPKTDSSVRCVFLPRTVAMALREHRERQDELKTLLGPEYMDFNLVIARENGRPYEEHRVVQILNRYIDEIKLPKVVFHSFRHCSATLKLKLSGGNIKAVQGDTGHSQARMVTELYAHLNNYDRRELARKMDTDFFERNSHKKEAATSEADEAYRLLQQNPEIARLVVAALQRPTSL